MRILHIVKSLSRSSGGPARSVQGLVAGLRAAGVDAWLMTLERGEAPWIAGCDQFINGGAFEDALARVAPDIVHLHGIWQMGLHRCAVICRRWGIPYVIAPRGMLEPWSLKQKAFKKRIARWLYQDRDLRKAAALHATAASEAEQFRRLGFKNYVIVSPNGVNVPVNEVEGGRLEVGQWNSESSCCGGIDERCGGVNSFVQPSTSNLPPPSPNLQSKRALFVSRMHPKKGVLELVEAWARVFGTEVEGGRLAVGQRWVCELVYTLNGETEKEYEAKVKQRILDLGLSYQDKEGTFHCSPSPSTFTSSPDFIFTGPLDDDKKWEAYGRADLFVLPTYSENFGIVVAEALWAGVPVITTKGTPWSDLLGVGNRCRCTADELSAGGRCGWWIELPGGKECLNVEAVAKPQEERALSRSRPRQSAALPRGDGGFATASVGIEECLNEKGVGERCRCTADESSSPNPNIQTIKPSNNSAWTALDQALRDACGAEGLRALPAMGENGHRLVEEKYTWKAVVGAMVHGYEQVLNTCELAPCDSCANYGDTCPMR